MSVPFFAAFMALWATFFLEFWKRKEKTFAMKWGMTGFLFFNYLLIVCCFLLKRV